MATKLNAIVALEKGVKAQANTDLDLAQKAKIDPFVGLSRVYQKKDDDGEDFPPETKRVQVRAVDLISFFSKSVSRYMDVVATKDATNCKATASVDLDGAAVLTDVPAVTLIFVEKMLTDLHAVINQMPTLDPAEAWTKDDKDGLFKSEPVKSSRTRKVLKALLKAPATVEHPAQTETYSVDEIVGTWTTQKMSGALPVSEQRGLLEKIVKLRDAVKVAREQANETEVVDVKIGKTIIDHLFGSLAAS